MPNRISDTTIDQQTPEELVFDEKLKEMLDAFLTFIKTAEAGDSSLIAQVEHPDKSDVREDFTVRMFLEMTGFISCGAPSYFTIEPNPRPKNIPEVELHDRVLGKGFTETGLGFTLASATVVHNQGATETIILIEGSLNSEDPEKLKKIDSAWKAASDADDAISRYIAGSESSDSLNTLDDEMKRTLDYVVRERALGATVLDLTNED